MVSNNRKVEATPFSILDAIIGGIYIIVSTVSLYYIRNVQIHYFIRVILLFPLIFTTGESSETSWYMPRKLIMVYYFVALGLTGERLYKAFVFNPPIYEHILYLIAVLYFLYRINNIIQKERMYSPKKDPTPDYIGDAAKEAMRDYQLKKFGKVITGPYAESNSSVNTQQTTQTNNQTNPYVKKGAERPKTNYGSREEARKKQKQDSHKREEQCI